MGNILSYDKVLLDNEYINLMCENLDALNIEQVYYLAGINSTKKQKILNHLFLRECVNDNVDVFIEALGYVNYLDTYIKNSLNGNDELIKAYIIIHFEEDLIDKFYGSEENMVSTIINNEDHGFNAKIYALLKLTTLDIKESTFELIQTILPDFVRNNNQIKEELDENQIEDLIDAYMNDIDKNRSYIKSLRG